MYESNDGFEIARRDLDQRGPGELSGLRQSGQALMRFAQWDTDEALVEQAREAAQRLSVDFPEHARAHMKRSEEHTSELQSLMRISYDVFCLKKKKTLHTRLCLPTTPTHPNVMC